MSGMFFGTQCIAVTDASFETSVTCHMKQ